MPDVTPEEAAVPEETVAAEEAEKPEHENVVDLTQPEPDTDAPYAYDEMRDILQESLVKLKEADRRARESDVLHSCQGIRDSAAFVTQGLIASMGSEEREALTKAGPLADFANQVVHVASHINKRLCTEESRLVRESIEEDDIEIAGESIYKVMERILPDPGEPEQAPEEPTEE